MKSAGCRLAPTITRTPFDIAGPNPTPREVENIDKQYSIFLEQERRAAAATAEREAQLKLLAAEVERQRQQAEAEEVLKRQKRAVELDQRRQIALRYMQVTSVNVECHFADSVNCNWYKCRSLG
jgi:hypothetical protein